MINKKQPKPFSIILILLVFSLSINTANAQGPNAPEAASFEPVDATDMVNLSAGSFTYVLPLLNIPSPEGGYPIALAYHAGIAMDQESSMIGLGWNLNPGAINRNVNGAPDDYNTALVTEHFWDSTQTITEFNASIGYSAPGGSVGLGLSWGSHKSLGGHVSMSLGIGLGGDFGLSLSGSVGTNGASGGIGIQTPSGLSFGIGASSGGGVAGNIGFDKNGTGFNMSTNGSFGVSVGSGSKESGNITSLGLTFSSSGVGLTVKNSSYEEGEVVDGTQTYNRTGGGGTGFNLAFANTSKMGDYTTNTSAWSIPLFIPVGPGFLSFSFGKSKFKFYQNTYTQNYLDGPLHYYDGTANSTKFSVHCIKDSQDPQDRYDDCGQLTTDSLTEAENYIQSIEASDSECECDLYTIYNDQAYMDILELSVNSGYFYSKEELTASNPNFPNYDKYNVQAQGLSGGITAHLYENKALFGISGEKDSKGNTLDYVINGGTTTQNQNQNQDPNIFKFIEKPIFYFENEISTYLETPIANFSYDSNILNTLTNTSYSSGLTDKSKAELVSRKHSGNYVEYYTNKEILDEESRLLSEGYLKPNLTDLSRVDAPQSGIGAFKITAIDGKTYHYSLPVYNHETIQRTYGISKNYGTSTPRGEDEAYFEKRQLEPYATHWLLTAITGPDYVDYNSNGIVDKNDYGYWVGFDYGKYSDGFVWTGSYGKDYIESPENNDVKTWIKGRKEQYYLDRIFTRTHAALFIKSQREDAKSPEFTYHYAQNNDDYSLRTEWGVQNGNLVQIEINEPGFSLPSQYPLKLDKIILVKQEHDQVSKSSGTDNSQSIDINYPVLLTSNKGSKYGTATINNSDFVLDDTDSYTSISNHIIKSIEFNNDHYDLVNGTPYSDRSARLTLQGVDFKGKNETSLIPPYRFTYLNSNYNFDVEDKDGFGYYKNDNSLWSLNEITTPQGGKIKVEYENHEIDPVINADFVFQRYSSDYTITPDYDGGNPNNGDQPRGFIIETTYNLGIQVGDVLNIDYLYTCFEEEGGNCGGSRCGHYEHDCSFSGNGTVAQVLGNNQFFLLPDNSGWSCDTVNGSTYPGDWNCDYYRTQLSAKYTTNNSIEAGGIRVKRISTVDENNNYYAMDYSYGENGNGVGYVTYLPFAPELAIELPYSSELPPPNPMYEYVTTTTSVSTDGGNTFNEYGIKTDYRFNVLKNKTNGAIKFGDFYEITSNQIYGNNNSSTQIKEYTIHDNLGAIGQLLGVKVYNQENQILSNLQNTYYDKGATPNKLGVTQESYQTYKKITDENNSVKNIAVSSTRILYPNLLKSSKEIKGGFSSISEFKDLDPISGQARETHSYNSKGLEVKSVGVQAFREYPSMGSKVINLDNKNMLTQSAGDYSYVKINETWQPISASITTWNNNWDYTFNNGSSGSTTEIWRKHKTYVWEGNLASNGTYNNFIEFDFTGGAQNSNWKQIGETTKYDQFSKTLEVKDLNNNYTSTKMGDAYSKIIATSNAGYNEMYYSGAEYVTDNNSYFDGQVKSTGYLEVGETNAHTGVSIVRLTNTNQNGFEVNLPEAVKGKFKVSVWARAGEEARAKIKVNNSQVSFKTREELQAGNWVLLNGYVDIPDTTSSNTVSIVTTGGNLDLDDFRLYPIASSMTSYVYNEWDELWYIIGNNGLASKFEYDAAGRLLNTYTEVVDFNGVGSGGFEKVRENMYNYKNQL